MSNKSKYTEVKEFVESKGNILLSKTYKNNKTKLHIMCKCGRKDFYRTLTSMKQHNAYYCDICKNELISTLKKGKSTKKEKMTYEDVILFVESKGCKFLSKDFNNICDYYDFECSCGNVFNRTFNKFKNANQIMCSECSKKSIAKKLKLEYDYVYNFILSKGDTLISKEYINNSTNLEIKCKCGELFYRKFDNYKNLNQYHCTKCGTSSKGESKIMEILDRYNINYGCRTSYKECRFKHLLLFDFVLYDKNIIIEYDGRQHFEIVKDFGGFDSFIDTKIRDTVKNIFCKNNNITLIRIPYWDFDNIEDILIRDLEL